jgi:hypothetical protein
VLGVADVGVWPLVDGEGVTALAVALAVVDGLAVGCPLQLCKLRTPSSAGRNPPRKLAPRSADRWEEQGLVMG